MVAVKREVERDLSPPPKPQLSHVGDRDIAGRVKHKLRRVELMHTIPYGWFGILGVVLCDLQESCRTHVGLVHERLGCRFRKSLNTSSMHTQRGCGGVFI